MFAAKACHNYGVVWNVIGKQVPEIRGPVFFHEKLSPSDPARIVRLQLLGSVATYAEKNTGRANIRTSAHYYGLHRQPQETMGGWSPNASMQNFLHKHQDKFMLDQLVSDDMVLAFLGAGVLVVDTRPAPGLNFTESLGFVQPLEEGLTNNIMYYIGSNLCTAIRAGILWDEAFLEYPEGVSPNPATVDKDLAWLRTVTVGATQDLFREVYPEAMGKVKFRGVYGGRNPTLADDYSNYLRVGRFATGNSRELAHDAYRHTWEWLKDLRVNE